MSVKLSKRLAFILRHPPKFGGVDLDSQGWASTFAILTEDIFFRNGLTFTTLQAIVTSDPKQRFEFDESYRRIRARYGHSSTVHLDYPESIPPSSLYHGTKLGKLENILRLGLHPMTRQYVHLSIDQTTALRVAGRLRGTSVLLEIRPAGNLHPFHSIGNGIWLSKGVSPDHIQVV